MIYIDDIEHALPVFRALDSEIRLKILQLLMNNNRINMNEVAKKLSLSNAAITAHMKLLNEARLVGITSQAGKRGVQKICYLNEDAILIKFIGGPSKQKNYDVDLNIGFYSDYNIIPTCGLATTEKIIGVPDNPSYFASPERIGADILWFAKGYLEYVVPNYLASEQELQEIQLSFEISSEAPIYCANWPSEIHFSLNAVEVGFWNCPANVGESTSMEKKSIWWPRSNQSGILKVLSVTRTGTFIDGMPLSKVKLNDVFTEGMSEFKFRISSPDSSANAGGITLYGINLGGFNQGIRAKVFYT